MWHTPDPQLEQHYQIQQDAPNGLLAALMQSPKVEGSIASAVGSRPPTGPGGREERKRRREVAIATGTGVEELPQLEQSRPISVAVAAATVPARPLEEEEVRLKAGTIKHCALTVLKEAGPEGMTIDGVMAAVEAAGLRTWEQTSKRIVQFALSSDEAFVRTGKGVYALAALAGFATPRPPRPPRGACKGKRKGEEGWETDDSADAHTQRRAKSNRSIDAVERAETSVARAQQAIEDHKGRLARAMEAAQDADDKAQIADRKAKAAAAATPSKQAQEDALRATNFTALVSLADEVPSIAAAAALQKNSPPTSAQQPSLSLPQQSQLSSQQSPQQVNVVLAQHRGDNHMPHLSASNIASQALSHSQLRQSIQHLQQQQQQRHEMIIQQQQHGMISPQQQHPHHQLPTSVKSDSDAVANSGYIMTAGHAPSSSMVQIAVPNSAQSAPKGQNIGTPPTSSSAVWSQALPAPQQLPQLPWSDLQQPQQQQSQQQQQQQLLARRGVIDAAVQQYGQTCEPVQQGVSQHKQTQPPASAPVQKQPVDEVHMNAVLAALPVSGELVETPHGMLEVPDFALTEEEKQYKGSPDDRRAVMQHRKQLQEQMERREELREVWLRRVQGGKGRGFMQKGKDAATAARLAKRAAEAVSAAERAVATAEAIAVDARSHLDREVARKARGNRSRADQTKRRAAAAAARRFPMDDVALMDFLSDEAYDAGGEPPNFTLPAPSVQLSIRESDRLASALYVADFLGHFGEIMGINPMPLSELRMRLRLHNPAARAEARHPVLAASSAQRTVSTIHSKAGSPSSMDLDYDPAESPSRPSARNDEQSPERPGTVRPIKEESSANERQATNADRARLLDEDDEDDAGLEPVYELLEALLLVVLRDLASAGRGGRVELRWSNMVGPGTWPEILRRYALMRQAKCGTKAAVSVAAAAAALAMTPIDDVSPIHHLTLLAFLCDEALDSLLIHNVLQKRLEDADAVRRDIKVAAPPPLRVKAGRAPKSKASKAALSAAQEATAAAAAEEDAQWRQQYLAAEVARCVVRREPLGSDRTGARYWFGIGGQRSVLWQETSDVNSSCSASGCFEDERRDVPLQQMHAALPGAQRRRTASQPGASHTSRPFAAKRLPPEHLAAWQATHAAWLSQHAVQHPIVAAAAASPTASLCDSAAALRRQTADDAAIAPSSSFADVQAPLPSSGRGLSHSASDAGLKCNGLVGADYSPAPPIVSPTAVDASNIQTIHQTIPPLSRQSDPRAVVTTGLASRPDLPALQDHPPPFVPHLPQTVSDAIVVLSNGPSQISTVIADSAHLSPQLATCQSITNVSDTLLEERTHQAPVEEVEAARWGVFDDADILKQLVARLDARGEREAALIANLEMQLSDIVDALSNGPGEGPPLHVPPPPPPAPKNNKKSKKKAKAPSPSPAPHLRTSRRIAGTDSASARSQASQPPEGTPPETAAPADEMLPSLDAADSGADDDEGDDEGVQPEEEALVVHFQPLQDLPAVEGAAVASACERLVVMCHGAERFGLPAPACSAWQTLQSVIASISVGEVPSVPEFAAMSSAASSPSLAAAVSGTSPLERHCLQRLRIAATVAEEAMWAAACVAAEEYARNTGALPTATATAKANGGDNSAGNGNAHGSAAADEHMPTAHGSDSDSDDGSDSGRRSTAAKPLPGGGPEEVLELSENEEERKKAVKKGSSRPSRQRGAPRLWRNARERAIWIADLAAASTVTRVAYCAVVLACCGSDLLAVLEARQRRARQRRTSRIPLNPVLNAAPKREFVPASSETCRERKQRFDYAYASL